jgi:phosphoribosylformimino-5-aminoimidazole carboxamide ribotide isomerase
MTLFRPCIDLRNGRVTQIVGGTLRADGAGVRVNYESDRPASYFAALYRRDGLAGGHVIQLGPGNEAAARDALAAWPGGLQLGGGVRDDNAAAWLDAGASHVIVTSFLFEDARFREDRLERLVRTVGAGRLVIDLSCRARGEGWVVATDRWQTLTDLELTPATLDRLAPSCAEFLVHAADIEGRCEGIDERLVAMLGGWGRKPVVYAGGARSTADLETVDRLSSGRVDLTIGSALDLFGGAGARYADCVAFNRRRG